MVRISKDQQSDLKKAISDSSREKKSVFNHLPLSFITKFSQPLIRHIALLLANYDVQIIGELPKQPSLLAVYPHGEHLNSLHLSKTFLQSFKEVLGLSDRELDIVCLAAADYWFANKMIPMLTSLAVNLYPISRNKNAPAIRHQLASLKHALAENPFHALLYPQGTRRGANQAVLTAIKEHDGFENIPDDILETLGPAVRRELFDGVYTIPRIVGFDPVVPVGIHYPDGYNPHKDGGENGISKKRLLIPSQSIPVQIRIGEPISIQDASSRSQTGIDNGEKIMTNQSKKDDKEFFMQRLALELLRLAHDPQYRYNQT